MLVPLTPAAANVVISAIFEKMLLLGESFGQRELAKTIAYGVLNRNDARTINNLSPKQFAPVILAAKVALSQFQEALGSGVPKPKSSKQSLAILRERATLPFGLHYLLRSVAAILHSDPALRDLSKQVENMRFGDFFKSFDRQLHEQGRRTALATMGLASSYLKAAEHRKDVTPAIYAMMDRHVKATLKILLSEKGYSHHARRRAARHVSAAIDVWTAMMANALIRE